MPFCMALLNIPGGIGRQVRKVSKSDRNSSRTYSRKLSFLSALMASMYSGGRIINGLERVMTLKGPEN